MVFGQVTLLHDSYHSLPRGDGQENYNKDEESFGGEDRGKSISPGHLHSSFLSCFKPLFVVVVVTKGNVT